MFKVTKFRMRNHLMPVKGWLNDPNGLIEYKGNYHIFYQATPDLTTETKCWGHYMTKDFKHYVHTGYPIMPDTEYESHGSYSGSATIKDGKMIILYTGNAKLDGDYDYINSGRLSSVLRVESSDGITFENKRVVLTNDDYPEDYSCHVRDPEIYFGDGKYKMILGGRTKKNQAALLIYESEDLITFNLIKDMRFTDLGYMLECPIYFKIEGNEVYGFSPQGVSTVGDRFQNLFSAGYCINTITQKDYIEWDKGFDFYAPKVFKDSENRLILIGWAGLADDALEYDYSATLQEGWIHCLTLPREIKLKNNRLYTYPIKEFLNLAKGYIKTSSTNLSTFIAKIKCYSSFEILLNKNLKMYYNKDRIEFSFINDGYGRGNRSFEVADLENLLIVNDASIVEVYFNDGEYVFTTRCFSKTNGLEVINGNLTIEISELEEYTYEETDNDR